MNIGIKLSKESEKKLEKAPEAFARGLFNGLRMAMFNAEKFAKQTFGKPNHLNVRTGRLRASIRVEMFQRDNDIHGEIGTPVIYGPPHEFGYPERNIPERPFIRPALFLPEQEQKHHHIIMDEINKELDKL